MAIAAGQKAFLFVLGVSLLTSGIGCGSTGDPPLVVVRGRILLDGRPLPRGSVALRSDVPGNAGHQPTGMINRPGEYIVYTNGRAGAPAGTYRVTVFASEAAVSSTGAAHPGLPRSIIPIRYNQPQETPLRLKVAPQSLPAAYDLELKSDET